MAKFIWKLVIIGDPAVGKTSIRRKYLGETTIKEYIYTICADFATKRIKLSNNLTVQYQIFDLAGQPKFDKVRSSFYNGAQAAILVYDITNNTTLKNMQKWVSEAKRNNEDGSLETFVMVGNKIDLQDNKKSDDALLKKFLADLSREMGHDILHIHTSALTGENIDLLFKKITEKLLISASKNSPTIQKLVKQVESKLTVKEQPKPAIKPKVTVIESGKTKVSPSLLERRLDIIELEINHLKSEVKELKIDIDHLTQLVLKYLHENKRILEELNLKTNDINY
ncbi:MAG: GTP-binding protein [Candidatus Heimdallarchaeota archaeon]